MGILSAEILALATLENAEELAKERTICATRTYVCMFRDGRFEQATKEAVQTLARLGMPPEELAASIRRCLNNMVSIAKTTIMRSTNFRTSEPRTSRGVVYCSRFQP